MPVGSFLKRESHLDHLVLWYTTCIIQHDVKKSTNARSIVYGRCEDGREQAATLSRIDQMSVFNSDKNTVSISIVAQRACTHTLTGEKVNTNSRSLPSKWHRGIHRHLCIPHKWKTSVLLSVATPHRQKWRLPSLVTAWSVCELHTQIDRCGRGTREVQRSLRR